jgi:RNA polymerase sigma-70 factor (ECF subfamily)
MDTAIPMSFPDPFPAVVKTVSEGDIGDTSTLSTEDFWSRVQRHGDKLFNFAWRLVGNDSDASDLVQEALARAFESRDRYDPNRPFDAWVGRILHNHFLDNTRRYERRHTVSYNAPLDNPEGSTLLEALPGHDPNPVDSLLQQERDETVRRTLAELPPVYRAALILCDIEKYSYETMADIMDCPVGTVRSRIHQGRRLLRESFTRLEKGAVQ